MYKNNNLYIQSLFNKDNLSANIHLMFYDMLKSDQGPITEKDKNIKQYFDTMIDMIDHVIIIEDKGNKLPSEIQEIQSTSALLIESVEQKEKIKDNELSIFEEETESEEISVPFVNLNVNDFSIIKRPMIDANNLTFADFDSCYVHQFRVNLFKTFVYYLKMKKKKKNS